MSRKKRKGKAAGAKPAATPPGEAPPPAGADAATVASTPPAPDLDLVDDDEADDGDETDGADDGDENDSDRPAALSDAELLEIAADQLRQSDDGRTIDVVDVPEVHADMGHAPTQPPPAPEHSGEHGDPDVFHGADDAVHDSPHHRG